MLILFFSDTNYVLEGFKAIYSITNCPKNCSNHGLCVEHSCLCTGNWIGLDCGVKACDCGDEENRGHCNKDRCECSKTWSGQSCSLQKINPEQSQWHWMTNLTNSFTRRASFTAIYHEKTDAVFIFGGYDLNNVLESLEIFRFNTSRWEDDDGNELKHNDEMYPKEFLISKDLSKQPDILDQFWFKAALLTHAEVLTTSTEHPRGNASKIEKIKPLARYGHAIAACNMEDSFVIFGGKLSSGNLSNELWLYNISSKQWLLRAKKSKLKPPKLTRHTLTYVGSNKHIYIFGGSLESGEFSSRMFRIRIEPNEDEQWEEVFPRGGKTFDFRICCHTTNYHEDSNSLIIYGGIIANVARLSKLSDRIFSFAIRDQHFTEIFYPKTVLREMNIPRERAFHSATISGNYLIIFGGYLHRHNKEEICYDNQMYLYHLGCHVWINTEALGANRSSYPKKQGIFAHTAVLRGDNTLLVIGGYHGNINNDFLAFTLHQMMIPSINSSDNEKCMAYKTSQECISNPECGYCSSDNSCYGRTTSNCFTNLQTTRCPSICQSLKDCRSCLLHGSILSKTKLPVSECTWCVQNAKCHQKNDYGCGESDVVEKIGFQWWGRRGVEIEDKSQCLSLDKPPGLYFLKYYHPFDFNLPDSLQLVNSTLVDFSGTMSSAFNEPAQSGEVVAKLSGFLRLPKENQKEILKVCGTFARIVLKTSDGGSITTAANFTAEQNQCVNFLLDSKKVLIDLQAERKLTNSMTQQHYQSKVGLHNNATKAFTFEFLEPYWNGSDCNQYSNCLHCLSDAACAWCDLTKNCLSRDVNETSLCRVESQWRYLIQQPQQCENCSNYIQCGDCTKEGNCEWWLDETKCVRKGRSGNSGVQRFSSCPLSCNLRKNCSSCLNEKGRCVWCETVQECFSFSVYTSEYQFGLCREWLDQSLLCKLQLK